MGVVRFINEAAPGLFAMEGLTGASYYFGLAVLVVAMIWGAVLAYRSWEEAHEDLDPATRDELLDVFEQARADGELDEDELARVRSRLDRGE
ncbi:hypothetical protein [Paludisphaera borealis]|uniref:SHOCT domain-containing protein n=1 Tax=Paludisphaera borealis TaxID=1387353 RepID=A0A1U7CL77_9BACT|nr:hypothetical protein [Paludisphaera borealis]APW59694.1 hypothetical protein BSF38_01125 [Paludisphaera borealis]